MATLLTMRNTPTPPPAGMALQTSQPAATPGSTAALPIPGVQDSASTHPVTIPNKHIATPVSSKFAGPVTPPASPPEGAEKRWMESLLYPPTDHEILCRSPPVYGIDAVGVSSALDFASRQRIPETDQLFPWAHGLHPENNIQLSFFYARKKSMRRPPSCYRGICIVKVGRDVNSSRLKGSINPDEILPSHPSQQGFLFVDPREGFCVRNFHIQVAKFAGLCDMIVYGDADTEFEEVMQVARRISTAQIHYRTQAHASHVREFPMYSTFAVKSPFSTFEELFPEIVTIDSHGRLTGNVVDFCHWERMEMCSMSKASEIAPNVFLGSTADARPGRDGTPYGVLLEASDLVQMPTSYKLRDILRQLENASQPLFLEFPGSGTISAAHWARCDVNSIVDACRWIHAVANGTPMAEEVRDADGDHRMSNVTRKPCKILMHCTDGYTETSLLALAYLMYAESLPVHEAWVQLHTTKKRNFFAYDKDLAFLRHIEHSILEASARQKQTTLDYIGLSPPKWIAKMDGSLPSRILPYMYLGNLQHANNAGLLVALGIRRVLSIGEEVSWTEEERDAFGEEKTMVVKDLQDNGCDPLDGQFWRCLEFIDAGKAQNEPILVHCRVGVSRSATICIAEVMRSLKLSLPRAYCYVRARRVNVIIQPHLRFMYELLKFEESLSTKTPRSPKRELEWVHIAREIATMNRPYTRQG